MYSEKVQKTVVEFYDKESEHYSRKRYEGEVLTYTQFFFRRRLDITISFLKKVIMPDKEYKLLEMACADGVVLRKVETIFRNNFTDLVGMDISPEMIKQAQKLSHDSLARYFIREETPNLIFDVILGIGYVSPVIIDEEFSFAKSHLKSGGYYICSLPGKNSLQALIQLKDKDYAKTYISYYEYEKIIKKYFDIVQSKPYGLFVPKLWSVPGIARIFQPVFETLFQHVFPNLFHERIYLLRKK